jgi:hypothetical protein
MGLAARSRAPGPVAAAEKPAADGGAHSDLFEPEQISRRLQGGSPMPPTTRDRMEAAFGRSFAHARVHTGATAAAVAEAHGAEAISVGQHIAFGRGRFRPGTAAGDWLIAHELAHVAQAEAGAGGVSAHRAGVSSGGEPAETAADRAADQALAGRAVGSLGTLSTRGRIMRRARMGAGLPGLSPGPPAAGLAPKAVPGSGTRSSAVSLRTAQGTGAAPVPGARRETFGARARLGGLPETAAAADAASPKTPDEAQTAIDEPAVTPPSAAVAGAPAGAAAGPTEPAAAEKPAATADSAKGEKEAEAAAEEKGIDKRQEEAGEAVAGARAEKKKGRFGVVPGDRGVKAAGAAVARLDKRAGAMEHHEPAGQRIGDASAAAQPPDNEGSSRAQGEQVAVVSAVEPQPPDKDGAKSAVRAAAEEAAPTNMDEVKNLGSRTAGVSEALGQSVGGSVGAAREPLDAIQEPGEAPEPEPAVEMPEPEPAPGTAAPDLAAATPPPVPDESLDASEFKEEAEEDLAANDMGEDTLAKAAEGPIADIAADKGELDDSVDRAGDDVRATETPANAEAEAGLQGAEAGAQGGMETSRDTEQASVTGEQEGVKGGEELDRTTASGQIEGIYQDAAKAVNEKLDGLSEGAVAEFDEKQKGYLDSFVTDVERELNDFKDERYSGALGWARWIKDRFVSINEFPEVQDIYKRNYDLYIQRIDALIEEISGKVDTTVAEAKQILTDAKAEIEKIVTALPEKMKADALAAQQRAEQRFAAMEKQIDMAAAQAKSALQARRQKAIDEVNGALAKIKAANASLVDKIKAAIQALVDLLGKFLKLMTRITRMGVGAFISAALSQAQDGIKSHLWGALQEAFKEWVFSKIPFLQPLLNLPPNWMEMLTGLALSLPSLLMENLPEMLPAIGAAAMIWLATNLAAKLIPGAGAIMAIIDGIRAAWGLIQSLLSAAEAFFGFVMKVAQPAYAAADFATALARGIVAGLAALLTFLGVDALIQRVGAAIAKPFGKIFQRVSASFKSRNDRRRTDRKKAEDESGASGRKSKDDGMPAESHRRKAEDDARRDDRRERRRDRDDDRRRVRQDQRRDQRDRRREDPRKERDRRKEQDRKREDDQRRKNQERLSKALGVIKPALAAMFQRGAFRLTIAARLAVWKLQFRLRRLSMEGSGSEITVMAGNSPDVPAGRAFTENKHNLYKMVRDIAQQRFGRASRAAEETRSRSGKSAAEVQPSVEPGRDPVAAAAEVREARPKPVPAKKGEGMGSTFDIDVSGTPVQAKRGAGLSNLIITALGKYKDIAAQLRAAGLVGAKLAGAVLDTLRTGEGPPLVKQFIALMFAAEPARGDIAAATGPLAIAGMETGTVRELETVHQPKFDERGGGGLDPVTMVGARKVGERAEAKAEGEEFRPGTKIDRMSNEYLDRMVEFVWTVVGKKVYHDVMAVRTEVLRLCEIYDKAAGIIP